jgi:hypothetical protein
VTAAAATGRVVVVLEVAERLVEPLGEALHDVTDAGHRGAAADVGEGVVVVAANPFVLGPSAGDPGLGGLAAESCFTQETKDDARASSFVVAGEAAPRESVGVVLEASEHDADHGGDHHDVLDQQDRVGGDETEQVQSDHDRGWDDH